MMCTASSFGQPVLPGWACPTVSTATRSRPGRPPRPDLPSDVSSIHMSAYTVEIFSSLALPAACPPLFPSSCAVPAILGSCMMTRFPPLP